MKSRTYKICFGTVAGYNVDNNDGASIDEVGKQLQVFIAEFQKKTGIYISGTLEPTKVIYATEFGAPVGGEAAYNFNISFNPKFTTQSSLELDGIVEEFATLIKEYYKQSTVSIEASDINYFYLTD